MTSVKIMCQSQYKNHVLAQRSLVRFCQQASQSLSGEKLLFQQEFIEWDQNLVTPIKSIDLWTEQKYSPNFWVTDKSAESCKVSHSHSLTGQFSCVNADRNSARLVIVHTSVRFSKHFSLKMSSMFTWLNVRLWNLTSWTRSPASNTCETAQILNPLPPQNVNTASH